MSALVMPSLGMAQTASPDRSAYILTPEPAPEPRINGARVFGARPGSDFIFAIAAKVLYSTPEPAVSRAA